MPRNENHKRSKAIKVIEEEIEWFVDVVCVFFCIILLVCQSIIFFFLFKSTKTELSLCVAMVKGVWVFPIWKIAICQCQNHVEITQFHECAKCMCEIDFNSISMIYIYVGAVSNVAWIHIIFINIEIILNWQHRAYISMWHEMHF